MRAGSHEPAAGDPQDRRGPPQNDACLLRFRLTGEQLLTTLPPTPTRCPS
ncbi:hypothetical protein ACH40F_55290 [Streptomyces sp. NPDC020794]